tara:strand:- start:465 stop:953 length:489 start_codon:yes stop_codon:yes gene_type:complete
MDILIIVISLFFIILGIFGSFIPVIPGPLTTWISFLIIKISGVIIISNLFLISTLIIAISVLLIDYIIPILGTKKFGGSKKGIFGSTIGSIIGFFILGPIGVLFGSFIGAFIGEYINKSNFKTIFKASLGSIIGFTTGALLKLSISLIYFILFIEIISEKYF